MGPIRQEGRPLASVIIPVFNGAGSLEVAVGCVDCHGGEVELVIVDDGSTDETAQVCGRLERERPWVHVISKANGGVSSARNAGMRAAAGEFVFFMDCDDSVGGDLFYGAASFMEKHSLDACSLQENIFFAPAHEGIVTGRDFLNWALRRREVFACWRYGFSRRLMGSLSFSEGCRMGEDQEFSILALSRADRVGAFEGGRYLYAPDNPGSATALANEAHFDAVEAFARVERVFADEFGLDSELVELAKERGACAMFTAVAANAVAGVSARQIRAWAEARGLLGGKDFGRATCATEGVRGRVFAHLWRASPRAAIDFVAATSRRA